MKINTPGEWWNWTETVLLRELRAQNWYNGDPALGLTGFMNDRANRVLGYGIIRQVRIKANSCKIPSKMYPFVKDCAGYSDVVDEDNSDYCDKWRPFDEEFCFNDAYK